MTSLSRVCWLLVGAICTASVVAQSAPKLVPSLAIEFAAFQVKEQYLPFGRPVPSDISWANPMFGTFVDAQETPYAVVTFSSLTNPNRSWSVLSEFEIANGRLRFVTIEVESRPPKDSFANLMALAGKELEF